MCSALASRTSKDHCSEHQDPVNAPSAGRAHGRTLPSAVLAFLHWPRVKVTVPAMLDIAYLALMSACLIGCVALVDRLSRSEDPTPPAETTGAVR